jgi:hypothetical protein
LLNDFTAIAPPAFLGNEGKKSLDALGLQLHIYLFFVPGASLHGEPFWIGCREITRKLPG